MSESPWMPIDEELYKCLGARATMDEACMLTKEQTRQVYGALQDTRMHLAIVEQQRDITVEKLARLRKHVYDFVRTLPDGMLPPERWPISKAKP